MSTPASKPVPVRLIGLGLWLITMALYLPAIRYDFLQYDDQQYVTENRHVLAGLTWPGVVWAFKSIYASNWHPLTWLSHMMDCQIYALRPGGHHFTNILLHSFSSILLFLALHRMTGMAWRSSAVAAAFAWHPLHVESVAWIAERKDVLCAFFWMLTLLAYCSYTTRPGIRRYLSALGLFALGLMSKPMIVTLPVVLILLDFWPLNRISWLQIEPAGISAAGSNPVQSTLPKLLAEKLPFLALSGLSCALTIFAQRGSHAIVSTAGLSIPRRAAHAAVAYTHYIFAMILPRHLAVQYPYPAETQLVAVAGCVAFLGIITFLAIRFSSSRPYVLVGWFWYLVTLLPVIGLVQVGDQAWADRYTYVPLIGLFIILVWAASEFAEASAFMKASGTPGLRILAGLIGVVLVAGTTIQLRHWKNTRSLFEHAAQVTAGNRRAWTVLGSLLAEEGKLEEAKGLYFRALESRPEDPEAHYYLGQALDRQGRLDEAIAEYEKALWFKPLEEQTHILLGVVLARKGNLDEAASHYEAALALNPDSALVENNLARLYHSQHRLDQAIEHYERAMKIEPALAQAHNNLGVALLERGDLPGAIVQLEEAVRLNSVDVEARCNLGQALNQQRRWSEAAEVLRKAARMPPDNSRVHCQLGLALRHLGETREAMSQYAHALLQTPDFPEALDGLSWILATDIHAEFRNGVEAVRMAERACELTAYKQPEMLLTLAAAYAEAGRFKQAEATAKKASALATSTGQPGIVKICDHLLESIQSGNPLRESAGATGR